MSKSRLAPLVTASYCSVNKIIVSIFVERWQPETNTFHMPFGEMTITLDDVASIIGIPVTGRTVSYNDRMACEEAQALLVDALRVEPIETHDDQLIQVRGQSDKLEWLRERFGEMSDDNGEEMIDCAVRAYLLYLLGCTLFTDKSGTRVPIIFLTHLVDLDNVRSYAWATAALAYLNRQLGPLGLASRHEIKQMASYLTLLEAWVYEHFTFLASTPNIHYQPNHPRFHRWVPRREYAPLQALRERLDSTNLLQSRYSHNSYAILCNCALPTSQAVVASDFFHPAH
ncbi:serine/threonine-protein phosphatase 7 long form isoform X1 [Cinnamomum micranthum f. kanehirae]|uniref:Serine/threonine-protein phosphatase 7 long form isoform X1 n=1 Tax=Cinnamomum micranthum f. kanehirae TaxID=337451 RepID=A0A443NPD2_9MAGN|nr:serine/threonine-protein phosphatase 7 long form isoform X1 [Cinnamomum micranthum f. kanehirae]